MNTDYEQILINYLNHHEYTIISGKDATKVFKQNLGTFEDICGEIIFDTLEDFFVTNAKNYVKLILLNRDNEVTSIFGGEINKDNILESSYTCSKEIPKGGVLLRFYALLTANDNNPRVTKMTGSIAGAIPPIQKEDSEETAQKKRDALVTYHIKNGANLYDNDSKFEYNIDGAKSKIPELFIINAGGKKKSTKKRRHKKSNSKKYKRITRKTKRTRN